VDPIWLAPTVAAGAALACLLAVGASLEAARQRLAQERQALTVMATSARSLAVQARAAHGRP
jgi:hypothetical protein